MIVIKFQGGPSTNPPTTHPVVIDGPWGLAEHVAKEYGDLYKFVPDNRSEIISKYGAKIVCYIGAIATTGHSSILEMIEVEPVVIDDYDLDELTAYVIPEESCSEEDWRDNPDE